jgi:membrane protein YqaA with SNARE-associated domain
MSAVAFAVLGAISGAILGSLLGCKLEEACYNYKERKRKREDLKRKAQFLRRIKAEKADDN